MRNRIISILLCLAMCCAAASIFAGCTTGNVPQVMSSDAMAQTIVLAMVKDDRTTPEAVKAVQDALNKITESSFNTHIILKMFTAEEYADKILTMSKSLYDSHLAYENRSESGETDENDPDESNADLRRYDKDENEEYIPVANGDLMYYDENGRLKTLYPKVDEDQLDVVFINSLDLYYELVRNQYVIALDDSFNSRIAEEGKITTKRLNMVINSALYDRAALIGDGLDPYGRKLFAIPSNYVVPGEEYILVNRKLYDHYQYSVECDIYDSAGSRSPVCDDLADFIDFLEDVAKNNEDNKTGNSELYVDKILYNVGDLGWFNYYGDESYAPSAMMSHSGNSFDPFTMNGSLFMLNMPKERYLNTIFAGPVFSDPYFRKVAGLVSELSNEYNCAPNIGDCFFKGTEEEIGFAAPASKMEDNAEKFALAMVKGDASVTDYYDSEDYYVVKINSPVVDNRMFDSMFAVSTFSTTALNAEERNLRTHIASYEEQMNPRCLEIIFALQTNAEIVNLLTYGIEGYNYHFYDNDVTKIVHNYGQNGYYPIVGKAGNSFLLYPYDGMTSEERYYSDNSWKAAKNQKCIVSPFCGIPQSEEKDADAQYSTAEITAYFRDFYKDHFNSVLTFRGKDDSGAACTIDEYLDGLTELLTSSEQYKCYTDCRIDSGYTLTPEALITIYHCFFAYDLSPDDIAGSLDEYVQSLIDNPD